MDRETKRNLSIHSKKGDTEYVKTIEWEDFEQELARLWSLSSALKEAKEKKQGLEKKLESLIQVTAESLSRSNELEEMRQRLEARKLAVGNTSMNCKVAEQDAKKKEESLSAEVRSLLVAGTSLSVAKNHLQESNRLLGGERGYSGLTTVHNKLRKRQRYMISQVSYLFPVKIVVGPVQEQELELLPGGSKLGNSAGSKPINQGSMTILGLHLTMLPFTKMSFFTDKKEVQRSATALGYVAHAVLLIASYLKVPLRYPLWLGGSHSYVKDYAPFVEPSSSSSSSDRSLNAAPLGTLKFVEFPLFLDGQDTTRAAYAVFLLNKDIEQLLNFIGANSLGPRHVLANLKELIRTVQSPDFVDT